MISSTFVWLSRLNTLRVVDQKKKKNTTRAYIEHEFYKSEKFTLCSASYSFFSRKGCWTTLDFNKCNFSCFCFCLPRSGWPWLFPIALKKVLNTSVSHVIWTQCLANPTNPTLNPSRDFPPTKSPPLSTYYRSLLYIICIIYWFWLWVRCSSLTLLPNKVQPSTACTHSCVSTRWTSNLWTSSLPTVYRGHGPTDTLSRTTA